LSNKNLSDKVVLSGMMDRKIGEYAMGKLLMIWFILTGVLLAQEGPAVEPLPDLLSSRLYDEDGWLEPVDGMEMAEILRLLDRGQRVLLSKKSGLSLFEVMNLCHRDGKLVNIDGDSWEEYWELGDFMLSGGRVRLSAKSKLHFLDIRDLARKYGSLLRVDLNGWEDYYDARTLAEAGASLYVESGSGFHFYDVRNFCQIGKERVCVKADGWESYYDVKRFLELGSRILVTSKCLFNHEDIKRFCLNGGKRVSILAEGFEPEQYHEYESLGARIIK